jgi:hypothetical protein
MAPGVSRDELEIQLAEQAICEPRVARSLPGRDPEDLTLDVSVAAPRM